MPTHVTANEKANNEFIIPVSWSVSELLKVQANSLEEAYQYVEENMDEIPLGDEPEYIDGSYEINGDNTDDCILYQNTKTPICLEFNCSNTFVQGPDPLQFVNGKGVASAVFHFKEDHLVVKLKALINGDTNIPDPFVYLYDQGQKALNRPLLDETPESILADMTEIAEQYFADKSND